MGVARMRDLLLLGFILGAPDFENSHIYFSLRRDVFPKEGVFGPSGYLGSWTLWGQLPFSFSACSTDLGTNSLNN